MFRAIAVLSLITLGACIDLSGPEYNHEKKEPEVNTVADSTVLVTMTGFSDGQSVEVWAAIFNGNMVKYWKAKEDCKQCLLPKTQYFLLAQTNLLTTRGDITL